MRSGRQHSVMAHQFSQVPQANIPRSSFDRSHGLKTTFNEKVLMPIFVDEALPGDTFSLNVTAFGRLATPIFPIMDNMYIDFFFFFVPNRLVWTHFVNFFGEQDNPADSTSFLVPTVTVTPGQFNGGSDNPNDAKSLADAFGIPSGATLPSGNLVVSALPFRSYNLIYNQWFRDENLQNSVYFVKDDGPDIFTNYKLLPRGKRKDYFTSALPWPQKGPSVSVPIGNLAWVYSGSTNAPNVAPNPVKFWTAGSGVVPSAASPLGVSATGVLTQYTSGAVSTPIHDLTPSNMYADLGSATSVTINQLRQSFQIQKIYERDARGGTRYVELIKAHFGVTSPDARLQRSEYLGGGSVPLNVSPIAQTSGTGASGTTTPLGNLSAMGTLHAGGVGFTKSFTEHGTIIGLCNLRADLNYQDGLDRMWTRSTRFDFYWPALSHIGEQGIRNDEIFAQGTAADTQIFGYQERYAEYRYKNSKICGAFRSASTTPLDAWHLSQHFATLPVLNGTFIEDAPPISRIVAVPSQPRILLDCYFKLHCARPMPVYGVPGLIDHF